LEELGRGHAKGRIGSETTLDQLVRNALGLELALDPGGQAHGPDALDVARTGTVGETVEDVEDLPSGSRVVRGSVSRLPTTSPTGVSGTTDRELRS
jgi:hypothetical protein